jgi:hypothetical protein
MPLLEIRCAHCGHAGYVTPDRLASLLHCSACHPIELVCECVRRIRARDREAADAVRRTAASKRPSKRVLVPGELRQRRPGAA